LIWRCEHPERCVIRHPFHPPHMVLVEVVGGEKTSPDVVRRAIDFYASIGKKPIHLRKEVVGHVANRLQAAIYREVVNLIKLGVVDVADADTAVCWGPGLRWGVMGPNTLFHLGGGQGGIQHFMEHLSGPVAMWWKDLGSFTEWPEGSKEQIVAGVMEQTNGRTVDELAQMRDEILLELVKLRFRQVEASEPIVAK
jgi:3-hydroxyacyl-CoA dehydrogenase